MRRVTKGKMTGQTPFSFMLPDVTWQPPDMGTLQEWGDARRVGIDVETRDDHLRTLGIGVRRGGYIVGISITIEDGPSYYLPIRHRGGDNLPEDAVLRYMREQAKKFRGAYVGANLPYDMDYLWQEGIVSTEASYKDVQVADPLINELQKSYSLKNIAERWGLPAKDETALEHAAKAYNVHPKQGLWMLPARFVGAYAEQDTKLPLQILRRQERALENRELMDVWKLECDVLPVLLKYRRRGVLIDQEKLEYIETWSINEEKKALQLVKEETGHSIDLGDVYRAESFTPALRAIGIEPGQTSTRADKVDAQLLGSSDHPVAAALLRARKVNKLRSTFAASIRRYMVDGRIHPTFNQIVRESDFGKEDETEGGRFGRLSSKDPNIQQQPSRDEFAKMWRSIYIAEPGKIWGCLDYSQQEPRWTTHWAVKSKIPSANAAAHEYRTNPNADNHDMMAKLTGLPRKQAKTVYLGICYGMGGGRLCDSLGLPKRYAWSHKLDGDFRIDYFETFQEMRQAQLDAKDYAPRWWQAAGEEGQRILDQFDNNAPYVSELAKKAKYKAQKVGMIRTASGRLLNFPEENGQYQWVHKALNRLIQGSAADQTKRAMVLIDQLMPDTFIQMQVHDEIDGSFVDVEEARRVAKIMSEAWPDTEVPFRVDIEMGDNWGEIKEIT